MAPQMTAEKTSKDSRQTPHGTTTKGKETETDHREDHGHDTNDCCKIRHQIEEAVKSGKLSHLVKGIKKGRTKVSDTQQGNKKKENKETTPVKEPILMISRQDQTRKRK
ncbi:hypothetical protein Tco_0630974 [Tanacetum coccineum]